MQPHPKQHTHIAAASGCLGGIREARRRGGRRGLMLMRPHPPGDGVTTAPTCRLTGACLAGSGSRVAAAASGSAAAAGTAASAPLPVRWPATRMAWPGRWRVLRRAASPVRALESQESWWDAGAAVSVPPPVTRSATGHRPQCRPARRRAPRVAADPHRSRRSGGLRRTGLPPAPACLLAGWFVGRGGGAVAVLGRHRRASGGHRAGVASPWPAGRPLRRAAWLGPAVPVERDASHRAAADRDASSCQPGRSAEASSGSRASWCCHVRPFGAGRVPASGRPGSRRLKARGDADAERNGCRHVCREWWRERWEPCPVRPLGRRRRPVRAVPWRLPAWPCP